MSKLLEAIQQNRETLLQEWTARLKASIQRRDLINDRELESQASEIVAAIAEVPQDTTLEDFNADGWELLKAMLAELSAARASAGFSPSETATFVLSIKPSLFAIARQLRGNDADQLFAEVVKANEFVDKLALHTTDVHPWTRSGDPPATGRDAGAFHPGSDSVGWNRGVSTDRHAG